MESELLVQTLTEQSVEVSVFAQHSDDERAQPFLRPPLQAFQASLINFLWRFKLVQTGPYVTGPGEEAKKIQENKAQLAHFSKMGMETNAHKSDWNHILLNRSSRFSTNPPGKQTDQWKQKRKKKQTNVVQ